ncbi:hypothetical protein NIES2134_118690 [Thermostichus vulcanus NIES-2134]|nr:hypothetical protein NIES2134_118690 [Thermostichus vulcanus NIES-2134]
MGVGIGINGFGRIGRLVLRAAWGWPELDFRHINEIKGGTSAAAHLLEFDSVHGRWPQTIQAKEGAIAINDQIISFSEAKTPAEVPWQQRGVEIVLECSGKFRTAEQLGCQCRHYWWVAPLWFDFCHQFGSPLLLGAGLH